MTEIKMTQMELQSVLGDRIQKLLDLDLNKNSNEEIEFEFHRSDMISRLAKQMINNADVVLRTDKLVASNLITNKFPITKMI